MMPTGKTVDGRAITGSASEAGWAIPWIEFGHTTHC